MARGRSPRYDDHHDTILREAARLFARRGYPATSMNQVAEACGLSKPAVYHYFPDKYSLLVRIAEGHVDTLVALAADAADQALTPPERMRWLIVRIIEEYADAQDAHRVLTEDVRFLEPADRARLLGKERAVVDAFAGAIGAWQPAQADAGLATPLTMLLFGMINWMFTWMRPDGALSHRQMAPVVADLFFGGAPAVRAPAPAGRRPRTEGGVRSASTRAPARRRVA